MINIFDPYTWIGLMRSLGWKVRVNYRDYMHSDAWRRKARKVRKRAGYRCQNCGKKAPLEVHHKTYERLGHERMRDLIGLCPQCHRKQHGRT